MHFGSTRSSRADAAPPRESWPQTVFDAAPVGLAVATLDGTWLLVNDTCCELLGYARRELLHFSLNELTHPDDARREMPLLARVRKGEQRRYCIEKRIMARDGNYQPLLVSVTCVPAAGASLFVYVVEPPRAAETGNGAGRLAIAILDELADTAVIRTDANGIITGWNQGAERMLGYRRQDVVGKDRGMLYDDRAVWPDRAAAHLRAAAEHGRHDSEDFRLGADGAPVRVHSSIHPYAPDGAVRGYVEVLSPRLQTALDEARREAETLAKENEILARALRAEMARRRDAERRLARGASRKRGVRKPPRQRTRPVTTAHPPRDR